MEGFDHYTYYEKDDKTDDSNYRGISVLPTTYNILSNILLPKFTQYAEGIIGDYQSGLDTTGQLLIIRFCRKAYDSVRREVFYNILNEFVIPMNLVRLIKSVCLKHIAESV